MKKKVFNFYTKLMILTVVSCGFFSLSLSRKDNEAGVGNWYEKLHWWKKAKPKYQEIVASVKKIKKSYKEFEAKRSVIMTSIHDLISSLKIDNKQLFNKINRYISELDTKIEEAYSEGLDDSRIIDQLIENKKNLEKLKQNFKLLDDLGAKVNEAIENVLSAQIQRSESYEEQAMNKLEELENVLDDKKAKAFYEEIQNKAENILSIEDYIQGPLKGYLNQSSIRLNQLINEIKTLMLNLENEDIYLSEDKPEPQEPAVEEVVPVKKEPAIKEEAPQSFFGKIISSIKNILNSIWKVIAYPFKWFF